MGRKSYKVKKKLVGNFIGLKNLCQKFHRIKKKFDWKFYRVKKIVGNFIGLKKNCVGNFIGLNKFGSEIF